MASAQEVTLFVFGTAINLEQFEVEWTLDTSALEGVYNRQAGEAGESGAAPPVRLLQY